MKKHLDIFIVLLFITFTISAIIAVIYVAKAEVKQDRIEYEREVFAPMRIHQKY
jgi:uncharacterized membrane protein (DUF485 family)